MVCLIEETKKLRGRKGRKSFDGAQNGELPPISPFRNRYANSSGVEKRGGADRTRTRLGENIPWMNWGEGVD